MDFRHSVHYLFPRQVTATHRERIISGAGGFLAILIVAGTTHLFVGPVAVPYLVAAMGASTVLLLAMPHSPLSQPWPVLGGHLVSALIGVFCAFQVPDIHLAAALAVGLSISAMYYLRCLHPPGGATALLAVIGDQQIHDLGYDFLLVPVLSNVITLLVAALVVNRVLLRRQYPHTLALPGQEPERRHQRAPVKLAFSDDDLAAALKAMGSYIDVTGADLERIYSHAILHTHRRRLGEVRLRDVMVQNVVAVAADRPLEEVWKLMRSQQIRGIPVVDAQQRVTGIVTVSDFLKMANWRMCDTLVRHVRLAFAGRAGTTAAHIMSSPAIVARADMHLTEAFLLFADHHINHLPVVDTGGALIGILTRLDLLATLYGDMMLASGDDQWLPTAPALVQGQN